MSSNSPSKQSGFTLLEVLITMAIMVFISFGIYQATTSAFRLREELNADAEFFTNIRLTIGLLNQDITAAYSPVILVPYQKLFPSAQSPSPTPGPPPSTLQAEQSGLPSNVATELGQTFTFWGAALDKTGLRPSRFIGSENKISFVSSSNTRIYRDSPESIFSKITYEFKRDDDPPINGFKVENSSVLVKTSNADVFDNDDSRDSEHAHVYPLLRGITQFHFTFYKWKDNSFNRFTSWDSDQNDFKYQFPDVIEVTMEVKGPTNLSFEGNYRLKPEIPLRGINPSF